MLKITLVHSLIAALPQHVAVAKSLGLHKVGDTTVQQDNGAVAGKIRIIAHLVKVEKTGAKTAQSSIWKH